ncbi:FtsX-like permease family protein [Streptomyces albipurpureus]|uniref:ABC transporter permease n=1 Tax=Streptomyces albipurpureus TaxID=2897419 RepID=A0ABT0UYL6_9ACTN|nr:ABC transporter permease [Streptomyces sp. CWNU-1]MCM2393366.1 ABC transporter permease [Streptomyces sp. CWNU-1]
MSDAPGRAGIRGWARDLVLGVRFAVTGGRRGWTRTALTSFGVGLGVALLLVAAAIPHAVENREGRKGDRTVNTANSEKLSAGSFLFAQANTSFRGDMITGTVFRPTGNGRTDLPPGLAALPGPGEMAVSPALADLLASSDGALLKERLPYRVTAGIGEHGLAGPGELLYYAGSGTLTRASADGEADGFGQYAAGNPIAGVLLLIVVIAFVALLLPVAVFIGTAVRFGGDQRDRRLAALRLVGTDRAMTSRIAAGEALCGALLGLVVGAGLFVLARRFAGEVILWDVTVYPFDLVPSPMLSLLILIAVPVAAIAVSLFAMRGVSVEPLGLVRNSAPHPRKLWWRLLLPLVGFVLLLTAATATTLVGSETIQIALGATLMLVGVTALLPWLVETVVARLDGGPVAWQLAVRRLQLTSGTASRAVSGIVVAAAGAIALQMLFGSVQGDYTFTTGVDTSRAQLQMKTDTRDGSAASELVTSYQRTTGVDRAIGLTEGLIERPGPKRGEEKGHPFSRITVADCPSLRMLVKLSSCKDGDAFIVDEPAHLRTFAYVPRPGEQVKLVRTDETGKPGANAAVWRLPATAREVKSIVSPVGEMTAGVLVTPSAIDAAQLPRPMARIMVKLDPGVKDAAEHVRNTAARLDPLTSVTSLESTETDKQFASIRSGLFAGAAATMALIAASLLVSTLEQLHERKRLLSILVAFGTRRSTLSWSVLWQTAIPIALGLALAVVGGVGLGLTLLMMTGTAVADWWVFLPITGVGAALILLVTLISMPPLWRLMRPDGLRSE